MAKAPRKLKAPTAPLKTPQDAICRITGCGRIHADRVVKEIGSDAANAVLKEAQKPNGNPRLALREGFSKSTAPSPHRTPAEPSTLSADSDDTDVNSDS